MKTLNMRDVFLELCKIASKELAAAEAAATAIEAETHLLEARLAIDAGLNFLQDCRGSSGGLDRLSRPTR
jgi:hypothetical protein